MKHRVFWDIETGPNLEKVQKWLADNPFDPEKVALGNRKDPAKIEAYIAEKRDAYDREVYDKAALNPATAQVLTIQSRFNGQSNLIANEDEKSLLEEFFGTVAPVAAKLINWTGSNTRGNFDLNMICRRAWALGVKVPVDLREIARDLAQDFLRFEAPSSHCGLERAARELGIDVIDTPVTGKDFHKWWRGRMGVGSLEDQRAAARAYALQDVDLLEQIYDRIA